MRLLLRKLRWILLALAIVFVLVAVCVFGPYVANLKHFPANPSDGFHADFYLYVSPGARRRAADGKSVTVLVQPNNSGTNSDDRSFHRRDAWWTGFGRRGIADDLGVVLLIPAFVRPAMDWKIYSHALDRDTLTTSRSDLARVDLQLIAMIDRARAALSAEWISVEPQVLIQGFSASGMFANRFTALHPGRVRAAAVGAPGGWPIAPLSEFNGKPLPYPAGITDLADLVKQPFDQAAFNRVPQLFVMGSLDDNDSLDFGDGWEKESAQIVDQLFGADPQSRWKPASDLYRDAGVDAEFILVEGVGHDRRQLQHYSTEFFRKVLAQ